MIQPPAIQKPSAITQVIPSPHWLAITADCRSRARARVRDILDGAKSLSVLIAAIASIAIFADTTYAGGEQTGGGRKGKIVEIDASGGEQTGGGRRG